MARDILSPVDLESRFALTEGNIFHGDLSLGQLFLGDPCPAGPATARPSGGLPVRRRGPPGRRRHRCSRLQRLAADPQGLEDEAPALTAVAPFPTLSTAAASGRSAPPTL